MKIIGKKKMRSICGGGLDEIGIYAASPIRRKKNIRKFLL